MAAVHRPDDATAAVAVVVVVAGEADAERVLAGLVVIPLAVADDLELGAVAVDSQSIGELVGPHVPATLVDDIEVLLSLGMVVLHRAAAVAMAEVQLAVEAQEHAVHAVVRVYPAEAGQERITLVGLVVAVGVFKHEEVGTIAHKDLATGVLAGLVVVLLDGDAHRHGEDAIGEHRDLVGLAVTVGVLEDLDPVGLVDAVEFAVAAAGQAIIKTLGNPDAAAGIDVDIGGVAEHRLCGPQGRLEPIGRLELPGGFLGADLRGRGGGPKQEPDQPQNQAEPDGGRPVGCLAMPHRGKLLVGAAGSPVRRAPTRDDAEAATTQVIWLQGRWPAVDRPLCPGGGHASRAEDTANSSGPASTPSSPPRFQGRPSARGGTVVRSAVPPGR